MIERSKLGKNIMIIAFAAAIVMNNAININLGAFHITLYRAVILTLTVFLLCSSASAFFRDGTERYCLVVFLVWILYGVLMLIRVENNVFRSAVKELIGLTFAGLSIFCLTRMLTDSEDVFAFIFAMRMFVILSIVLGLLEIVSGFHLPSSCFRDPVFIQEQISRYGSVIGGQATGFQYNMNDYCSFLAFMTPLFLYERDGRIRLISWGSIALIMLLCLKDQSTICFMTVILCVFLYLIVTNSLRRRDFLFLAVVIAATVFVYITVSGKGISGITRRFGGKSIMDELIMQYQNYRLGIGSLFIRMTIYKDSLIAFLKSRMLGIGPASFADYFTKHPSKSKLVNPHNLWLEILTQYGLLVFMMYIALLVKCWKRIRIIHRRRNDHFAALLLVMLLNYIIVAVDPSAFLGYPYQWILIGMCLCIIRMEAEKQVFLRAVQKENKDAASIYNIY